MPRGRPRKHPLVVETLPPNAIVEEVKPNPPISYAQLIEKVEALEKQNAELLAQRTQTSEEIAAAQNAFYNGGVEQPTGRTVEVSVLDKYKVVSYKESTGRPILRPLFKKISLPTFKYKIDMPPCGDVALKINDEMYYHGAVYEFDLHTLRTVKDIVARTWEHDRSIHPHDENFYRRTPDWQMRNSRAVAAGVFK